MDHREPRIVDDSVASPRRSPHRGHAIAPQRESVQRSRLVEASCPGLSQVNFQLSHDQIMLIERFFSDRFEDPLTSQTEHT